MFTLHDLPADERPRERLIRYGAEVLSLQELLAIVLGRGTKGEPVMIISQKLLSKFGSLQNLSETSVEDLKTIKGLGLAKACQLKACFELSRRLFHSESDSGPDFAKTSTGRRTHSLPARSLTRITKKQSFWGGGDNRRRRLQNLNDRGITPKNIYQLVRSKIINYHKEHLLVVSLDNRNKIIGVDTVSIGTLNSSLIHPRETFEAAIKHHAAQIILTHNHPSGELIPSEDDLQVTKNLVDAGKILSIEVIDHLIITKEDYYSFAKNGLI